MGDVWLWETTLGSLGQEAAQDWRDGKQGPGLLSAQLPEVLGQPRLPGLPSSGSDGCRHTLSKGQGLWGGQPRGRRSSPGTKVSRKKCWLKEGLGHTSSDNVVDSSHGGGDPSLLQFGLGRVCTWDLGKGFGAHGSHQRDQGTHLLGVRHGARCLHGLSHSFFFFF